MLWFSLVRIQQSREHMVEYVCRLLPQVNTHHCGERWTVDGDSSRWVGKWSDVNGLWKKWRLLHIAINHKNRPFRKEEIPTPWVLFREWQLNWCSPSYTQALHLYWEKWRKTLNLGFISSCWRFSYKNSEWKRNLDPNYFNPNSLSTIWRADCCLHRLKDSLGQRSSSLKCFRRRLQRFVASPSLNCSLNGRPWNCSFS